MLHSYSGIARRKGIEQQGILCLLNKAPLYAMVAGRQQPETQSQKVSMKCPDWPVPFVLEMKDKQKPNKYDHKQ